MGTNSFYFALGLCRPIFSFIDCRTQLRPKVSPA